MSDKTKTVLTWNQCRILARRLVNVAVSMSRVSPAMIYGVPRGGLHVAQLIESVSEGRVRIADNPESACLIVDDIVDSGKTRNEWVSRYPNKTFHSMVSKDRQEMLDLAIEHKGWVVFPWETEDEPLGGEDAVRRILQVLGEDPDREGLIDTPKRYVKAMKELTSGMHEDPRAELRKLFTLSHNGKKVTYDGMVYSGVIPFYSTCEHHLLPFYGEAHIGYIPSPGSPVVGLSKLARVFDIYSRRLQVQERLTQEVADTVLEELKPSGVGVVVKAKHTCQCMRGVKKEGVMITDAVHGIFRENPATRQEFFSIIALATR